MLISTNALNKTLRSSLGDDIRDETLNRFLPAYMINLSPFEGDSLWQAAIEKAKGIVSNQSAVEPFVSFVKDFMKENAVRLSSVEAEISDLMAVVSGHRGNIDAVDAVIQCAAALYYLVNPFDAIYDFYLGIGFEDDIRHIKQVHAAMVHASEIRVV